MKSLAVFVSAIILFASGSNNGAIFQKISLLQQQGSKSNPDYYKEPLARANSLANTIDKIDAMNLEQLNDWLLHTVLPDSADDLLNYLGQCRQKDPAIIEKIKKNNKDFGYNMSHYCERQQRDTFAQYAVQKWTYFLTLAVQGCHFNMTGENVQKLLEGMLNGYKKAKTFFYDNQEGFLESAATILSLGVPEAQHQLEQYFGVDNIKQDRTISDNSLRKLQEDVAKYIQHYNEDGAGDTRKKGMEVFHVDMQHLWDAIDFDTVCDDIAGLRHDMTDFAWFMDEFFKRYYEVYHNDRLP